MEYEYDAKKYLRNRRMQRSATCKGPIRVCRLLVLCVIIPATLLTVPLYMRFRVYKEQVYPVGVSDMRLLDNKISTTWCQGQQIQANTTFNAYVLSDEPEISPYKETIDMRRFILLRDGGKEYWGFYLLRGSSFKISSCVRWPGASMFVIEGHRNLKECAYLGDNSSEEQDDSVSSEEDRNVTVMEKMTKILPGIFLNYNEDQERPRNESGRGNVNVTNADSEKPKRKFSKQTEKPKTSSNNVHLSYAEDLYAAKKAAIDDNNRKNRVGAPPTSASAAKATTTPRSKIYKPTKNRQSKMGSDESRFGTSDIGGDDDDRYDDSESEQAIRRLVDKLRQLGDRRGPALLELLNKYVDKELERTDSPLPSDEASRRQRLDDIENIFNRLQQDYPISATDYDLLFRDRSRAAEKKDEEDREFKWLKKVLWRTRKHKDSNVPASNKTDDNLSNIAEEEKDEPADVRGNINVTKQEGHSKSEYWSSISSSEERLLRCNGLLVSLPLIPHRNCEEKNSNEDLEKASELNSIWHRIVNDGYYFFVFNNENEIKDNFFHLHFLINKTVYDTSKPVASCQNQIGSCSLPLTFWSYEKLVLEIPVADNETNLNEEFMVVSTCEPRGAIYLICIISVPIFIILFAFQ